MNSVNPDPRPLIAHVVYRFDIGGLENGVVSLINHLPFERYRHAIISLTDISDYRFRILPSDVRFLSLHKSPGPGIKLFPAMWRLFRRLRPALVHTNNLAALEASLPARMAGVRACVHTEHGWDVNDLHGTYWKYRCVRRFYRPYVSRYTAVSKHLANYLVRDVGFRPSAVEQIYNGVDTEHFSPVATGSASPMPSGCPFIPGRDWLVGTVGRMETVKDQVNLARAFVHAVQLSPEARARMRLVIVGDGPKRTEVEQTLQEGGVRELAWLPGARQDIAELLRSFDVFTLPSIAEGIPYTLLEAMATGLPSVASHVGGIGELIEHGRTGLLTPPRQPEALADALLGLLHAPESAQRMGNAAREKALAHYSLQAMVQGYDRLYQSLLET